MVSCLIFHLFLLKHWNLVRAGADCWMMYTDVPERLTLLAYASYRCLAHLTNVKTIVGYGIRMYFSSRRVLLFYVHYSSFYTAKARRAKATFSKSLGAVFKKSSATEGTQAIGNTLWVTSGALKVWPFAFSYYPRFIIGCWKHSAVSGLDIDCKACAVCPKFIQRQKLLVV